MSEGRAAFVTYVSDNSHSPFACLGAAISWVRVQNSDARRIADAADAAIKKEIEAIKAEKAQGK